MADSVRVKKSITLKSQANLGEEIVDTEVEAGAELAVVHDFDEFWLVKDDDGKLFHLKKEFGEEA